MAEEQVQVPGPALNRRLALIIGAALYLGGALATCRLTFSWAETEEVVIGSSLRGMWLWPKAGREPYPAVLFANGAAGTLEHNLPPAIELAKHGVACLLFDFGGQGGSPGPWDPERDIHAVLAVVRSNPRIDRSSLAGVGHSMGGLLLCDRAGELRAVVSFGAFGATTRENTLIAYSRFEFLFDEPSGNVAVGPWSDHITGPMDPVLIRAALRWLGHGPAHPITEPWRILTRILALLGGALVVLALFLFVPALLPRPAGDGGIPASFLYITAFGTMVLPALLARRERPAFRVFAAPRWFAALLGAAFFVAVYFLAVGFASWSYYNVALYARKFAAFAGLAAVFTLILWHDQALLHGRLIEQDRVRWRELWLASLAAAACRWAVAAVIFVAVWVSNGRAGIAYILAIVSFVTFWLEGLAVCLSVRARHPLAGAAFLGLTWAWLWVVFIPA